MFSDFFTATAAELDVFDVMQGPSPQMQSVRTKRVDPVKIVQLQCCIEGVSFEERLPLLDTILVREAGEDGPWIIQLPELLESRLALLSPMDIDRYGREWAATEEWQLDGGAPDWIVPLLGEIAALASSARAQQKSVFVWIAL